MTETTICQSCKKEFAIDDEDKGFYEQMHVPPPTWCPQCRLMRRLAWFSYRMLNRRKCDFTGESILSAYHSDAPFKVYRQDIWWSDKWDPKSYGRDYDFNRSFFEQFSELQREVPLPALHSEYSTMIRSEYCNAASELKNCYLAFGADRSENSAYINRISFLKDCFDLLFANYDELCYESVNLENCYAAFYSQNCDECRNVWFSSDLVGCSDCFGCINLRSKNYHIFNQPYTKESYLNELAKMDLDSAQGIKEAMRKSKAFMLTQPRKNFRGRKAYESSGDYLYNTKNCRNCYLISEGENLRYCQLLQALKVSKAYDYTSFAFNAEWIYESCWVGINTQNVKFSFWNYSAHDIEYSYGCHTSGNVFGCIGLRKGEYCILNKQYSKEEYCLLVDKIKKQMMDLPYKDKLGREYRYGEFFPVELCPWLYNETVAFEFFPISKETAIQKGYGWRDDDRREYRAATMQIPDKIKDVQDDVLKAILKCDNCGKNYQIIPMELQFLRRFSLPIPRQCPLCRDRARVKQLNPMAIYERICAKCNEAIETSYAPDRPEIVYCESCYQQEVT